MKKYLFIAAAVVFAMTACNKEATSPAAKIEAQNEISFVNSNRVTKGYLADATFFDVAIADLHEGEDGAHKVSTDPRTMQISAFLTPQAGEPGNYFVDYTYAKGSDNKWHHTPAIYWPIAGSLDFLAYSSKVAFDPKDVTWNEGNASESVVLNVLEDRTQDDIVFCSVKNQASSTGASAVAMEFKHSQAWLEFQIKVANESMENKITIKSIEIENIYNTGELTLSNNSGNAEASWNFRHELKKNVIFEDNYDLYDAPLTKDVQYMDMLLPDQDKTSFVITYTLAGQDNELKYRYDLTAGGDTKWLMGDKYIYEIVFTVNEITVAPTVTEYAAGTVTDFTPTELK